MKLLPVVKNERREIYFGLIMAVAMVLALGRCTPVNSSLPRTPITGGKTQVKEIPQPQTVKPTAVAPKRIPNTIPRVLVEPDYSFALEKAEGLFKVTLSPETSPAVFEELLKTGRVEVSIPEVPATGQIPEEVQALFLLDDEAALTDEERQAFDSILKPLSGNLWQLSIPESVNPVLARRIQAHLIEVTLVFSKSAKVTVLNPESDLPIR